MSARVLVLNAGSSSLKYRLLDGATGEAEASGTVERIGEASGTLTHSVGGEDHTEERKVADFEDALRSAMDAFDRHVHGAFAAARHPVALSFSWRVSLGCT